MTIKNGVDLKAKRIVMWLALALWLPGVLTAQDECNDYGPQPTGAPQAKRQYKANLVTYKGKPNMLVLPGLVADRTARTVEILAESTGLQGGELAEFLLVDQASSHGYEALLWSFAKPSDVHRALEFIGLKPGTPFNPAVVRLWSDGDRVAMHLKGEGDETAPIETLIMDTETEQTLPEEGFVFAGSIMVPPRDGKGPQQYAADVYDPRSVASVYNEPAAVLDVPRQIGKGEAYGSQVVNPEMALEGGKLVTLLLTPADPDGQPPARQLVLSVDGAVSNGVAVGLAETNGAVLASAAALTPVLERLAALKKEGVESIVELSFGEALPLAAATKTARLMAVMESLGMVRIKPPAVGALYYRAFVPNKAWFSPEGRPTQPWELHLSAISNGVAGRLVWQEPVWSDDVVQPTFKPRAFAAPDPKAVRARIDSDAQERQAAGRSALPSVLLVYAEPTLTYGQLMTFLSPLLESHGTVHVFLTASM